MLQEVLVDSTLKEGQKVPEKSLELKINLGEEKFKNIQQKLAGKRRVISDTYSNIFFQ